MWLWHHHIVYITTLPAQQSSHYLRHNIAWASFPHCLHHCVACTAITILPTSMCCLHSTTTLFAHKQQPLLRVQVNMVLYGLAGIFGVLLLVVCCTQCPAGIAIFTGVCVCVVPSVSCLFSHSWQGGKHKGSIASWSSQLHDQMRPWMTHACSEKEFKSLSRTCLKKWPPFQEVKLTHDLHDDKACSWCTSDVLNLCACCVLACTDTFILNYALLHHFLLSSLLAVTQCWHSCTPFSSSFLLPSRASFSL